MTEIKVTRDGQNICGLELSGHSGYAKRGHDIVCAALSTLIQALEIGLTEVLDVDGVSALVDEEKAYMGLFWRKDSGPLSVVLIDTIIAALKSIAKGYPSHTRFVEVNVNEDH